MCQDIIEELDECNQQLECLNGDLQAAVHELQMDMESRIVEIKLLQASTNDLDQGLIQG